MFGLLLIFWLGMVQAVHWHGTSPSASATKVCAPAVPDHGLNEQNCPLCTVLHSVLPVSASEAWLWSFSAIPDAPTQTSRMERLWDFSLYGRPPPVS